MSLSLGLRAGRTQMDSQQFLSAGRFVVDEAGGTDGGRQQRHQGRYPPVSHVNALGHDRPLYESLRRKASPESINGFTHRVNLVDSCPCAGD